MTAHELAKKLLECPDLTVEYNDAEWGGQMVDAVVVVPANPEHPYPRVGLPTPNTILLL